MLTIALIKVGQLGWVKFAPNPPSKGTGNAVSVLVDWLIIEVAAAFAVAEGAAMSEGLEAAARR